MKHETGLYSIYLDMDSLMDTRLPTILKHNREETLKMLMEEAYDKRIYDHYGFVGEPLFKKLYNERDNRTLESGSMTTVIALVRELVGKTLFEDRKSGGNLKIKIYLNLHPYTFNDKNKNVIEAYIRETMDVKMELEFLEESIYTLDATWFTKINAMFIYHGLDWFDYNIANKSLKENPLPNLALFTPALVPHSVILKKEHLETFFNETSDSLSMFVKIFFVSIKFFSANSNINTEQ